MLDYINCLPLHGSYGRYPVRKRTASGRAQRASARNQNGATPAVPLESTSSADGPTQFQPGPSPMETDSLTGIPDDEPVLSRSNSSLNLHDLPAPTSHGRTKRKDKGKGKEVEPAPVKVKEEPKNVLLPSPDPPTSNLVCSPCLVLHLTHLLPQAKRRSLLFLSLSRRSRVLRWMSSSFSPLVSRSAYGERRGG